MDVKDAIKTAKNYVREVLSDENLTEVGVEETEFHPSSNRWTITLGVSRGWNGPRTRAQEVLETLGATSASRRSLKVVTMDEQGTVLSMKNKPRSELVET